VSGRITLGELVKQTKFKEYPAVALSELERDSKAVAHIRNLTLLVFALSIFAARYTKLNYKEGWKRSFFPLSVTAAVASIALICLFQWNLKVNHWWKEHVFSPLGKRDLTVAVRDCASALKKELATDEELLKAFQKENCFSWIVDIRFGFTRIGQLTLFLTVKLQETKTHDLESNVGVFYPFIKAVPSYDRFTPAATQADFLHQLRSLESEAPH
jgi:hypothetical protein